MKVIRESKKRHNNTVWLPTTVIFWILRVIMAAYLSITLLLLLCFKVRVFDRNLGISVFQPKIVRLRLYISFVNKKRRFYRFLVAKDKVTRKSLYATSKYMLHQNIPFSLIFGQWVDQRSCSKLWVDRRPLWSLSIYAISTKLIYILNMWVNRYYATCTNY